MSLRVKSRYRALTILTLLLVYGGLCAQAQKAYDKIIYISKIHEQKAVLELADGFLLASKITLNGHVLQPASAEPDDKGNLQFFISKRNNPSILLKGLNQPILPKRLIAVYFDGRVRKIFFFVSVDR